MKLTDVNIKAHGPLQILIILLFIASILFGCAPKSVFKPKTPTSSVKQSDPALTTEPNIYFEYKLSPGDELSIKVYADSDLNRTLKVYPNGSINFPLIGNLQASNKTPEELQNELTARLKKYLVDPKVDINLNNISGFKLFVLGEVKNPGVFSIWRRPTYLEAISLAGGFTKNADQTKLLSVNQRKSCDTIKAVQLKESLAHRQLASADEIIYIPPSKISDIEQFMLKFRNILAPFLTLESGIILAPQVRDALNGDYNNNNNIIANP